MEYTYEEQVELNHLLESYQVVEPFMKKYKRLSYIELDYSIVHDLTLFTIKPDFSFEQLEAQIDRLVQGIPAIKQIFAKPFIHLKDETILLPTEAVRIINNHTIQHISSHSELWTDIKDNQIEPAKLLTRTYEDNYGIYENIVFCKVIDDILSFTRSNIRILKELIYTNQTIEINILERVNHLNYFLALGKLHTGYSRNFSSYYGVATKCLNRLQFILNTIQPRLKRPVYKNNQFRPKKIKLHKTNILSMHKDYHQIYKLSTYFAKEHIGAIKDIKPVDMKALQKNYFHYCLILFIFSIGHFNFTCEEEKMINFSRFSMEFHFKNWKLKLKNIKLEVGPALSIQIEKDQKYEFLCIPSVLKETTTLASAVKEQYSADEYIICTPYEDTKGLFLSMMSIESFRRIQQIILRGMILTDQQRTDCPFCHSSLTINEEASLPNRPVYECLSCRTSLSYGYCPTEKKAYSYTKIAGLTKRHFKEEAWLLKRKLEAQMYFRNITAINEDMEILCPYCNKVHP